MKRPVAIKVGTLVRHISGNSARQVGVITEQQTHKVLDHWGVRFRYKVLWSRIQAQEEYGHNDLVSLCE